MPRKFDAFFAGTNPHDYVAILRPAQSDNEPRKSPLEKERSNLFPDHNVYLNAKFHGPFSDWAKGNYPELVAARMIRYAKTKDERELATLTQTEITALQEKIRELSSK